MNKTYLWLQGGLGNQLFQLNAGLHISRKRKSDLKILLTSYKRDVQRLFELGPLIEQSYRANFLETVLYGHPYRKTGSLKSFVGLGTLPIENFLQAQEREKSLLVGFFQDQASLGDNTDEVCELLSKVDLGPRALELKNRMNGRAVLHVRRGDYVSLKSSVERFGSLDLSYYLAGLERIGGQLQDCIVFSDDPRYVSETFKIRDSQIVGPDLIPSPLETLVLMGSSDKLVIPNSSFSWWAAELVNRKFGQVAGPSRWFLDLPPTSSPIRDFWHQIEN